MKTFLRAAVPAMLLGIAAPVQAGGGPDYEAGEHIAQSFCANCHAVGMTGESPLEPAPPFRTLHKKWPVENLEESLAEGIVVGHKDMPAFELSTEQIFDLIGYLRTLER